MPKLWKEFCADMAKQRGSEFAFLTEADKGSNSIAASLGSALPSHSPFRHLACVLPDLNLHCI